MILNSQDGQTPPSQLDQCDQNLHYSSGDISKRKKKIRTSSGQTNMFCIMLLLLFVRMNVAQCMKRISGSTSLADYTINTQTTITIQGANLNSQTFDIGDTFTLTFYSEYANPPAGYESFLDAPTLALTSATPAATITKVNSHSVRITLTAATAAGGTYKFDISGFKTPFSQIATSYSTYVYESGAEIITYQSPLVYSYTFNLRSTSYNTPTIAITDANPIVGASDASITITIPTPGLDFSSYGGNLIITVPRWYSDTANEFMFQQGAVKTECSSTQLQKSDDDYQSGQYTFTYSSFLNSYNRETQNIELTCTNFRNPVYPQTMSGFTIELKDADTIPKPICTFPGFSLDATGLQKLTLSDQIIYPAFYLKGQYDISTTIPIQTQCTVEFNFTMPIPNTNENCYLSIKFPDDIQLTSESYIYQGYEVMQTDEGKNMLKVSDSNVWIRQQPYDLSNLANSNMIVMKGCNVAYRAGLMRIRATNMNTPDSVRTTNNFELKLYKDFEPRASATYPYYAFSKQLLEGTKSIASTQFTSGTLTSLQFEPSLLYIQTDNLIKIKFTLANDIPAYKSGELHPKIVIVIPKIMTRSTAISSALIVNLDGSLITGLDYTTGDEDASESGSFSNSEVTCSSTEWTCFWIKPTKTTAIPAGTDMYWQISGATNQLSVQTAGNFYVQTRLASSATSTTWSNVDYGSFASNFQTIAGTITPVKTMDASSFVNYASDVSYFLFITLNNYIPANGYIQVQLPLDVSITSRPTCIVYLLSDSAKTNLVDFDSYNSQNVKVKARSLMAAGEYTIEWTKNKNPRTFYPTGLFNVTISDSSNNMIGNGQVSNIRMTTMASFNDLSITQTNQSNGILNNYIVKFKAGVPLESGDIFILEFPKNPKTIQIQKEPKCVKGSCMDEVDCSTQGTKISATITITDRNCKVANKEFSFTIIDVKNAASTVQSSLITAKWQSNQYQNVAQYGGQFRIQNLFPGLFNKDNINLDQDSKDYSVETDYIFRVKPTNPIPRNSWVEIKYPKSLVIKDDDKFLKACSITTYGTFDYNHCHHRKIERIVTFYNTFIEGDQYTSEFSFTLKFTNPSNNFDVDTKNMNAAQKKQSENDDAFQITTVTFDLSLDPKYATTATDGYIAVDAKKWAEAYLAKKYSDLRKDYFKYVDYFPYNTVKPKLKCNFPCYTCLNNNANYCLSCWGIGSKPRFKYTFLQYRTTQTCLDKCDDGFTTNGIKQVVKNGQIVDQSKTYFKCVDCDSNCLVCEGQDKKTGLKTQQEFDSFQLANPKNIQQKQKCLTCPEQFPYIVKKEQRCYDKCVQGYFEKTISFYGKTPGECVKCSQPCELCRKCYQTKTSEKNKDEHCNLKALSGVSTKPFPTDDPSSFFCTKCYQTAFFPLHVDDVNTIEGFVSNQNGMVNNRLAVNFLDTKNPTIKKYSEKLENKFKEGNGVIDIDKFMNLNVGSLFTDGGMAQPAGIQITNGMTYKQLYLAQYKKFKFPLRGLYNNRCVDKCPSGTTNIAGFCQPCDRQGSHCEECRNSIKKCTKCLQTQPFRYLLGVTCRDTCPSGTVADPKQGRCLGCVNGCKRCDVNDQKVCYECQEGLLLYIQSCVGTCPDGWRETFSGKKCVPEGEHTIVYFPLLILALLAGTISIGGKYSSKNISGQHKRLMSFYAFFGVIDVLAMWAQLLFTPIYGNMWMLAFPVIALLVNYYLNYQYKKLWDIIDPPKPQDEDKLVYEEVLLINQCDQNFDNWNTKYFNVGLWIRRITIFLSHKFFQMPFTHFFGYLHLTMRTQDFYCMWQWEDKEAIRFKRGFITQDDLKNTYKPFQYRGKLVPRKIDNFDRDMLLQDKDYQFEGNVEGQDQGDIRQDLQEPLTNQIVDADKEGGSGSDRYQGGSNSDKFEGGELDYNIYDMEGGHRHQETINPYEYTQHYANYPRKDHEKVPDTRVFDLYKKQVKIDIALIRPTLIIGNLLMIIVALAKRSASQLLIQTIESIIISIIMIFLQIYFLKNWEDHRLPYKMKNNKSNYLFKQKKSPKEQNKNLGKTEEEQLMPQRSKYMHLYKFNEIFLDNKLEEMLNIFGRRLCRSCIEFNTGTEKETDPRKVKSWPLTPTEEEEYRKNLDFDLIDFQLQNNVYAETAEPTEMFKSVAQLSTVGAQVFAFDVQEALNRKGGDLVTPGIDDDYHRRQGTKKKRGRKNKYYKQIDQEDDEEANQISDDSENDGLNLVKEEEEEDEDEELVRKRKAAEEQRKREEEEKRLLAEEEARKAEESKATKAAKDAKDKQAKDEADRLAKEQANRNAEDEKLKKDIVENHSPKKMPEKGANIGQASESDKQSNFSAVVQDGNVLGNFQQKQQNEILEVPPNADTRKFNECDIFGDYDRDEKGNVVVLDQNGKTGAVSGKEGLYLDKQGSATNQRGYLIDQKTGNVLNNLNGEKMFNNSELDDRGEIPAPFNVEKHNFNPHRSRGDFDYDRNGKPIIKKNKAGEYVDKKGARVSARGYRIDKDGHLIDNYGRKKFDKQHLTSDGDLPKLFNYNGRRFDITDVIGQLDKDANGEIMPLTDKDGQLRDKLGRKINTKGYLIDEFGNVVDKDGRQIFEAKHLENDEIPKIFPWTKFNVKNVLGDFEMDPLGNPILEKDNNGNLIDRKGQRVNSRGYLIDKNGNVINKQGKMMFKKKLLDSEDDIPKVFRTGLLKSDTASSLSRLMSEIERNQPSDFDQEEQEIQNEIQKGIKKKRPDSGQTSVDSMMEDTPANYNQQNQRFQDDEGEDMDEGEGDDYGSQYDGNMGLAGTGPGKNELSKKKRKKKKKKRRKPQEMEDPNVREYMLAGAYGGEAKPKPKRSGIKYTTDLAGGMRDLTTPGMLKQASKANLEGSVVGGRANSSRGRGRSPGRSKNRNASRVSDAGSQIGSRVGSKVGRKIGDSTSNLLDPQQREAQLKQKQMDEIRKKQIAKAKKLKAQGKVGKISKDADFEKMFGKDIDEFLEDSEWDIESIDKMSQFSKNSKNTIRSASQASKLRGLEKTYLARIETTMNKNSNVKPNATGMPKKDEMKKKKKFRDGDDSVSQSRKKAWDTQSKASSKNQSINKVFQNK